MLADRQKQAPLSSSRFFFPFHFLSTGFRGESSMTGSRSMPLWEIKILLPDKKEGTLTWNQNHLSSIMHSLLSISPLFPRP
ncbi:hypothetical protein NC653_008559 [Populus alba x Populus x berolinensis]|uniref:Uncharacterized protein n=1 Tax=Populus alba x Populus x berolinensis TaxID=444605 RepID=A0AAD6W8J6_9ROSI|nr:hypothetical protein NC653_008559 [Populus alba x Populus x berolinensis]